MSAGMWESPPINSKILLPTEVVVTARLTVLSTYALRIPSLGDIE